MYVCVCVYIHLSDSGTTFCSTSSVPNYTNLIPLLILWLRQSDIKNFPASLLAVGVARQYERPRRSPDKAKHLK